MTLAETQLLLRQLITAPEGVAAALAADADRGGALRARLEETVAPSPQLDAVARLEIYANMYFYRLLDVVKADYPATAAALGEANFHNLITDYLLVHPPSHFSVRYAGQLVPEFLAAHHENVARGYLSQLAAFERALTDAFDAADDPALTVGELAAIPPAEWAGIHFRLHPSVRLLRANWAVHTARECVDRGDDDLSAPEPGLTRLCVWRRDLDVVHRVLDGIDFDLLERCAQGTSFADVCAAAADQVGERAAPVLAEVLARWVSAGCVARAG